MDGMTLGEALVYLDSEFKAVFSEYRQCALIKMHGKVIRMFRAGAVPMSDADNVTAISDFIETPDDSVVADWKPRSNHVELEAV